MNQDWIKITPDEIRSITIEKFISVNSDYKIQSCVISIGEGAGIKDYAVRENRMPADLKERFAQVRSGQLITVEKRIAIVDGREMRLPSVIYKVVDRN